MAAILVVSPGATMVVVADSAIAAGRRAGLWTVAGVGAANATLALACAFGLSAVLRRYPELLRAVALIGAGYLAWLGLRALWRARGPMRPAAPHLRTVPAPSGGSASTARFGRGLITNYSNPSVVLFYAVVVPQFISPQDAFLRRYLLLGGTHVAMSVVWLIAFAISIGTLSEQMTRPRVRRALEVLTGVVLLALAVKVMLI